MTPFEIWWYHEGSAFRPVDEDIEEFSRRMCKIAWEKAQAAEREACAQICEGRNRDGDWFAAEIRARSQP